MTLQSKKNKSMKKNEIKNRGWKSVNVRGVFEEAIKNNRNKIKNRNTSQKVTETKHLQIIKADRNDLRRRENLNGYI